MPNFPTTAWNLLDSINESAETSPESKNRFITGYWSPVFAYFRAKGVAHEQAEDFTQDFFCRLFEKEWLKKYDLSKGSFRTFLLTIVQRFLADNSSARMPKQKKFESGFVPISCLISQTDFSFDAVDHQIPESVFMRQWAKSVVQATKDQLHLWCKSQGRPDWYSVFASSNPDEPSLRRTQEQIGDSLRLSRDQVRYALDQTEKQFVTLLREEVSHQVPQANDIDDEIRDLKSFL